MTAVCPGGGDRCRCFCLLLRCRYLLLLLRCLLCASAGEEHQCNECQQADCDSTFPVYGGWAGHWINHLIQGFIKIPPLYRPGMRRIAGYAGAAFFWSGQTGPVAAGSKSFAVNVLFISVCSHDFCMVPKVIGLFVICIAAISIAGCMTHSAGPAGIPTLPVSLPETTPAVTVSSAQVAECTGDADCVPAECCHPSSCTAPAAKSPCNLMCTASCEGPLDCGAGSCGCVNGTCSIIPASSTTSAIGKHTAITLRASPRRYSPVMSSTPGIGLEPVATGFGAENASFAWKTTYGQFLSWNSPDFKVNQLGDSASNHGEKLYWSFYEKPSSTASPVTITVTATDTASGHTFGSSTVTLAWEGNYSVTVKEVE
jgi:hypothetical protein